MQIVWKRNLSREHLEMKELMDKLKVIPIAVFCNAGYLFDRKEMGVI